MSIKKASKYCWIHLLLDLMDYICCFGVQCYLTTFIRASLSLGHAIRPMIDDPKNIAIKDNYCLQLMDLQWVFGPLETYLFFLLLLLTAIAGRIWLVSTKQFSGHKFRFYLQGVLLIALICIGSTVMFWLED